MQNVKTQKNETTLPQIHDRLTRGESLSPEETAALEIWCAQEDAEEQRLITPRSSEERTKANAQAHIASMEKELRAAAERLQALSAQNESLRQEIAKLQVGAERRFAPVSQAAVLSAV